MVDGGNDDQPAPCNICTKLISSDDLGLYCEGFCKGWYHPGCVTVDETSYHQITTLSEYVKWFCQPCADKVYKLVASEWVIDEPVNLRGSVDNLLTAVNRVLSDNTKRDKFPEKRLYSNYRLGANDDRLSDKRKYATVTSEATNVNKAKDVRESKNLTSSVVRSKEDQDGIESDERILTSGTKDRNDDC